MPQEGSYHGTISGQDDLSSHCYQLPQGQHNRLINTGATVTVMETFVAQQHGTPLSNAEQATNAARCQPADNRQITSPCCGPVTQEGQQHTNGELVILNLFHAGGAAIHTYRKPEPGMRLPFLAKGLGQHHIQEHTGLIHQQEMPYNIDLYQTSCEKVWQRAHEHRIH